MSAMRIVRVWVGLPLFAALVGAQEPAARLDIAAPGSAPSGSRIEATLQISTAEENVIGWSLAVACEGLSALEATASGTDFDRFSDGGYAESGIAPDGGAVYSIAVLSFLEPVALPAGTWSVLRTALLVSRKDPGPARLALLDRLQLPGDDREIQNEALLQGGDIAPLAGEAAPIDVAGCADFLIAASGGTGPFSVEAGTAIDVDVGVRVASSLHWSPQGFTLAVAHEEDVLEIDSVMLTALAESLAGGGGFSRVETSEEGWKAAVTPGEPASGALGPGDHVVAQARYRYAGSTPEGSALSTALRVSDGGSAAALAPGSTFLPGNALPCALPSVRLELFVAPKEWARGDGNSDGRIDLADGVAILLHLFQGGAAECFRAMETNSDAQVDLADAVFLLSHLFLGGPAPAAPFPGCGILASALPCEEPACPAR
jgi:hypothetical protein